MNLKGFYWAVFIVCVMLIPQFYIGVVDIFGRIERDKKYAIPYPILPLIEGELSKLKPAINEKLNLTTIDDICSLASGRTTQGEILSKLLDNKENVDKIKRSSGPESLLLSDNKHGQEMFCAAYVVNLPYAFPEIKYSISKEKQLSVNQKLTGFDRNELIKQLQLRLAILQTNAEIFALIARSLTEQQGRSINYYRNQIRNMFMKESGLYLAKVGERYNSLKNKGVYLSVFSDTDLVFSVENNLFSKNINSTTLQKSGSLWYGNNYLIGSQYYVYATSDPGGDGFFNKK